MAEPKNKTGGASRQLRVALGVSLAVNLLVVGVIGGGIYRHAFGNDRSGNHHKRYGAAYIRALPSEDRKAIREVLRQGRAERASAGGHKQKQLALLAALRADPFDISQVSEILGSQRKDALMAQKHVEQLWLSRIAAMEPDERDLYADRLELELSRRGAKKRFKQRH